MKQALTQIRWGRWGLLVGAGAALWVVVYLGAAAHASSKGAPVWQTVVTWDEWIAAIGLLPGLLLLLFGVRPGEDMSHKAMRKAFGIILEASAVLVVLFVLDLVARGVLGLGFKPF